MFRKTMNALCAVGAAAALCAVAPGASSADIDTLWVNGEAIVQNPNVDQCYPLVAPIQPGDEVHNDTPYELTGYRYRTCDNEAGYLNPGQKTEVVERSRVSRSMRSDR